MTDKRPQFDYARLLRERHAQYEETRSGEAPIGLNEYRARQYRERWLAKRARLPDPPEAA
jgi:hypothetical protein